MAKSDAARDERLLRLFYDEAHEQLNAMNIGLLEIEAQRGERAPLADGVLRAAHSVKGAAMAAGLKSVSSAVHEWESRAQVLRGTDAIAADVFEALYRTLDELEALVEFECTGTQPELPAPSLGGSSSGPGAAHSAAASALADDAPQSELGRAGLEEQAWIRVATDKVQRLMSGVEDLVAIKSNGTHRIREVRELETRLERAKAATERVRHEARPGRTSSGLNTAVDELGRVLTSAVELCARLSIDTRRHVHGLDTLASRLQDDIRSVRMIPIEQAFSNFPRLVRDVSRKLGKAVEYELSGGATQIDRDLVDVIKDPVMHLLRNAVAHGIEPEAARLASGKSAIGRVRIEAVGRAGGLQIAVRDDGAGVDLERVRKAAVDQGLLKPEEAGSAGAHQLNELLFRSGFSTARTIDELSGRGVGLDVVRRKVEDCGGSVTLESSAGLGTEFIVRLPLNLTSMRMLLTRVGTEQFCFPINAVVRVLRVHRDDIMQVDSGPVCKVDGRPVPVERLSRVLGIVGQAQANEAAAAVLVSSGTSLGALLVDGIDGEHELIVKGLGEHLGRVRHIAGATVLASGRIVPLLNVADLIQALVGERQSAPLFDQGDQRRAKRRRILIVDDSITTRTLESSILEAAGYEVVAAIDGVDALAKLAQDRFDLVLSDLQMPRMDGIELVTRIKSNSVTHQTPVILVSSLASEVDRARGLKAGADAYLGKGEFSQELLLQTLEAFL